MKIIIAGRGEDAAVLQQGAGGEYITCSSWETAAAEEGDVYFNLFEDAAEQQYLVKDKPVFIHAVTGTLAEKHLPPNILRINAWPGFLERSTWEVAGRVPETMAAIAAVLQKTFVPVADLPGLVAARVIATVINEAFFALGEGVSTREEIDTAMKLGTNYPYGPFEWADRIGIRHIRILLEKMSLENELYTPSPLMSSLATVKH